MSTATLTAPDVRAGGGTDILFLGLSIAATAILLALVLLDGQYASAALIVGGFGLGIAFLKAEFSYTASWRRFLTRGEAGGMIGGLIVIAIAAVAVVPVAALKPDYGGAIAPLGPSLIIGAFVFGIGMQLANGCGSGTLYTVGGGSGRMLIALLFFIIGSVLGSVSLPPFLALGGIDPVLASDYLGPWGGLAATLLSIAVAAAIMAAIARRRGANWRPSRNYVIGGVIIGLLCVFVFAFGGHPWSVTFGYTLWGAKAMAGPQAGAGQFGALRHVEPHRLRHAVRRHGRGRRGQALRAQCMAADEVAARRRHRRVADGLGRAPRLRLQHRRLRRRNRVRLGARLGLVRRLPAGMPYRNPPAPAIRLVEGLARMIPKSGYRFSDQIMRQGII
jgi:uncharacterized membrane protein YedE/YeeE